MSLCYYISLCLSLCCYLSLLVPLFFYSLSVCPSVVNSLCLSLCYYISLCLSLCCFTLSVCLSVILLSLFASLLLSLSACLSKFLIRKIRTIRRQLLQQKKRRQKYKKSDTLGQKSEHFLFKTLVVKKIKMLICVNRIRLYLSGLSPVFLRGNSGVTPVFLLCKSCVSLVYSHRDFHRGQRWTEGDKLSLSTAGRSWLHQLRPAVGSRVPSSATASSMERSVSSRPVNS